MLNTRRTENWSLSQELSLQFLIYHSLLCIPNLQTKLFPDCGVDFQSDFSMLRSQTVVLQTQCCTVAVTTFNNILLCVCTEWKVFDFCLFSIELDVGEKKGMKSF